MRKRRVLHVSTAHPPTDPRIVYKVMPSLVADYEVIALLPHVKSGCRNGMQYQWLPRFKRVWLRVLISQPGVLGYTLWFRPALLHIYDPELLPVARLLQWLLRIPVVYEVHENLYKKMPEKVRNQGAWLARPFRWFDAIARRHFYLIFTEHGYLDTYTNLTKPHEVIYNYPLLSFLEPFRHPYQPSTTHPEFFYIGWLSMERAFDTLITGLALLKHHYPNFIVHLFGDQTFTEADLNELSGYRDVRSNLRFYGFVSQPNAFPYAARATAGIALLKPVGDYPESYTTKLFEYMALGLPVLTADFPLYRTIIEGHDCGFCISPYEPKQVANALIDLIENRDQAQQMGERGRLAVEKEYNWSGEAVKLLRFYETVLGKQAV